MTEPKVYGSPEKLGIGPEDWVPKDDGLLPEPRTVSGAVR